MRYVADGKVKRRAGATKIPEFIGTEFGYIKNSMEELGSVDGSRRTSQATNDPSAGRRPSEAASEKPQSGHGRQDNLELKI
jgi:hypothetical protein